MLMYRKNKRVGHHRSRKTMFFFPLALHWIKRLCTKLFSLMVKNITSPLASLLSWERSGLFLDCSEAVWNSLSFFCWFPFDHSKVCGPCAWSALWDTPSQITASASPSPRLPSAAHPHPNPPPSAFPNIPTHSLMPHTERRREHPLFPYICANTRAHTHSCSAAAHAARRSVWEQLVLSI